MPALKRATLPAIYKALYHRFGPQHWWPGDTKFEIIIGAILTQNTNWRNVEKAINNLKEARALNPTAMKKVSLRRLAMLIRPSGYFNIKAKRIKHFIKFLFSEYDGLLERMQRDSLERLRTKLLSVNGIGPETADSILLYAFNKPVFVIDAYTKRVLYRHGLVEKDVTYHAVQEQFTAALTKNEALFNEYHALIVRLAKDFCRPLPLCAHCPLNGYSLSAAFKKENQVSL